MIGFSSAPENTQYKPGNTEDNAETHNMNKIIQILIIPVCTQFQMIKPVKKSFKLRLGTVKNQ